MPGENARDPRVVLKRDKYFSLRPQPLEQWLWRQGVAPSAERVFWLHWQEGVRNADWCSEIPIRRVAQLCCLDVSTVTRAYQLLTGLGLIRRADPGRDPANPFQQATAITEVRIPRELRLELDRHPNRSQCSADRAQLAAKPTPETRRCTPTPIDPFSGFSLKHRLRALGELTGLMSPDERQQFDAAQRLRRKSMQFEQASRLSPERQARVLQWLEIRAVPPPAAEPAVQRPAGQAPPVSTRKLTVFELARLRRELQRVVDASALPERLREIVWSMEQGALRRFEGLHAMRIALKKIREGAWSRPNRMPPNWARALSAAPPFNPEPSETCRIA
jgi:hypothetical protein